MYTTKYDNIDIDSVINNERLMKNYIGCLMDENSCTPDGLELKKNLPDALATDCASCSPAQKRMADKMYHHMIDNRPEDWNRLEKKFDPTGHYKNHYLETKYLESTTMKDS
ncbi:ejaculatory bulb-specific protein 3-like isoform X2 [Chelonus insularis]|nr:ejaculatory bulb-specific protein 3-like isoform X2 [Chelonus insularis]